MTPHDPSAARDSSSPHGRTADGRDRFTPPDPTNGWHDEARPGTDAVRHLLNQLKELREYASYFLAAKLDGIRATIRKAALWGALGILGAIVGLALLVTCTVLLLVGLANGLSTLAGTGPWLGNIVVGGVLLAAVGLGAFLMVRRMLRASRDRTVKKYEQRQIRQRRQFGRDLATQARAAAGGEQAGRQRG